MANELKLLKLTELSLVDRPANPLAMAPIFKRDESQEERMTENTEKLAELEQEIETLKADVEATKAENERLRKGLIENDFVIKADTIEKKAPVEYIEVDGEQIVKSDIPAVILKRLEEAEVEKAEAALTKRASEELPNFDVDVAKALVSKGFDEEVMQALKAADKFFEEMMTEKGQASVDDLSDPNEKLDAMTKAYADEHGVPYFKAQAEVLKTEAGKTAYKEIQKKDK